MKKILSLLYFVTISYASQYPDYTTHDLLQIEKNSGRIAKNRAMDYQKQVKKFQTYNKTKQLNAVNSYLNQLLPQYDEIMQKKEDYWASPKEFLALGYGDCEDYVIIKYYTLIKLGFDKDKLFFTTVYEQYNGSYHMVLAYFKDKGKAPLVLDNLSFRILSLQTRTDIKADVFINSRGVFKINKNNLLQKIAHSSTQYSQLIKKIQKEL